ncbi:hypothetical protein LTR62_008507 [Meristemomyces frigidus]|uniref:Mmc1 C-terminal domain-containing protein n=1 Tax=Meristemomyces frigidus TaxID=1508187 RepID=A0AAN7TP52_9PEZI|nr:hypothetical protein LTR62_008507 [Meristemomyces frigidus]
MSTALRTLRSTRSLATAARDAYLCPICLVKTSACLRPAVSQRSRRDVSNSQTTKIRRPAIPSQHTLTTARTRRHASNGSLASATAINAPSTVPPPFRELHQQLLALEAEASTYVSLSRLQLAIRSLESEIPVTRIAVLGLGVKGAQAARKLARVLLSDALADEEDWEHDILQSGKDGRSLLLRYGDRGDTVQHSRLLQTLSIPSPFLRRHHLEVLVTTLTTSGATDGISDAELEEALLVPSLVTPTSAGGRVGFVRYPVHKALVAAEGITGAVEYGRLPRFVDKAELIHSALSLPLRSSTGEKSAEETTTDNVVDVDLATHALGLFRTNKANGAQFSEEWQTSRLPHLSQWVAGSSEPDVVGLKPAVRNLLNSILLTGSAAVEHAETEQTTLNTSSTIPDTTRTRLDSLISHFAADWHRDLQTNLPAALDSRTWRRTAWFRLLWRIDDVSVSAADILRQSWLTEAEQTLAFLSGRIEETGLATSDDLRAVGAGAAQATEATKQAEDAVTSPQPLASQAATTPTTDARLEAETLQTITVTQKLKSQTGVNALFNPPWPQTIHLARQQILHSLVPALHLKAQTLVLTTLTTIAGSSALGAWIWVAFPSSGVQYAGAIAALGSVWSLRRLQKLWGKERDRFVITLKEDGRRVLADVEGGLRRLVRGGGRVVMREDDLREWARARGALQKCREVLERIK